MLDKDSMKSFEDWWDNEYVGSSLEEGTARAAWEESRKEVLEWVKGRGSKHFGCSGHEGYIALIKEIDQELGRRE